MDSGLTIATTAAAPLLFVSVFIPFFQTAVLGIKCHINFPKNASADYRREIYHRWWRVFVRTPFASSVLALCWLSTIIMMLMSGRFQIVLNGRTPVNPRLLTVLLLITMSAITVHTNLVVMRKCQDIIHSRLELEAHGKKKTHKQK